MDPLMKTIKALLFDLGNVLLYFSHDKMREQLATVTGLSVTEVRALLDEDRRQWRYEAGDVSTDEIHEIFRGKARRSFARADLLHAASDIFTPHDAMVPVLQGLKDQGYRLVIVSNTNEAHMQHAMPRYECFRYFDEKIFSFAVKAMKPDPRFYDAALAAAGCERSECLFADDLAENVEGARRFGFHGVLFTTADAFKAELPRHGIQLK